MRRGRKSAAQTPAPKKDRVYGSKTNPKGSASSEKSAKSIVLSDKTILLLRNKLNEFKEKHPKKSNITLNDLKAVYRRGLGAYSSSHRPTITGGVPNSRSAWATARVNKFLLKAGGAKVKAAYVQDDDLMADGGTTIENIKCINCGWDWNIEDSTESDKYICHNCNFDNTPYYQNGGLIAPNGNPSNLTPEQYNLVRTPEFKAWFGDWENSPQTASKVVDENGEPLVVYRGSIESLGSLGYEFKLGFNLLNKPKENYFGHFFTDDIAVAEQYQLTNHWGEKIGGEVNSFFIKSNKNLNLTDFDTQISLKSFVNGLTEKGVSFQGFENMPNEIINYFEDNSYVGWGSYIFDYFDIFPELRDLFLANGYDSVLFLEKSRTTFPYNVYVAFESNQIKLADGTNTTFDANNPDIRFAEGGLIAPNGKPSNLTPEQYKLVRTPEFKEWFGDWENSPETASKVIDENGEPLVVYHGSENKFYVFDKKRVGENYFESKGGGFFFTQKLNSAKNYARLHSNLKTDGFIYDCFLNIKNPLFRNTDSEYYNPIDRYDINRGEYIQELRNKNIDGIIIIGTKKDNLYVVYNPNQIKLADGTNTTFDANSPDIRFADGGRFDDQELLNKYKAGKSIGFTGIAHLKAKGLIPRADGTKRKSDKYKEDGGEIIKETIKLPELDMQYENLKETLDYQGYVLEPKFAKGGKLKGSGDCYYVAGKIAMGDFKDIDFIGTPYVVHAEVEGQGKISGIRYGHAWVEDDENVYDYSNGNEFVLPKIIYYSIGNIKTNNPKKYRRYTFDQARLKMLETRNYGCWDLDVKYADGGETESDTVNIKDFESKIWNYKKYIDNQLLEKIKDKDEAMVKVITKHFDDLERKNIIFVLGGNAKGYDLEDISKKHNKSIEYLLRQYFKGLQDELVHVNDIDGTYSIEDFKRISQIVLDHLDELPNYYEVNKVVEQKIEEQKYDNIENYLKFLNTMIEQNNDEELEKLLAEEDEYMQKVNTYIKDNNPEYLADGGETTFDNISQEMVLEDYFEREKTLADALLLLNRSKIYKVMYCNKKIEYAEKEELMAESGYDKNAWNYVANIWKSTLGVIKAENTEYKHGGTTDCGCMHKYGKGGLAYGNSHDNGGIKATVASTGQSIEYEGGEGVINKRSMQIEKTYDFNGKKLTPCEIVSQINQMGGGVKFKCEDVKPIIANDGSYKN